MQSPALPHLPRRRFLACAALAASAAAVRAQGPGPANDPIIQDAIDAALEEHRSKALAKRIRAQAKYLKPLVAEFGPEAMEIVKRTTVVSVRDRYANREIEDRGLDGVKSLLWDNLDADVYRIDKVEDMPTRLSFRVHTCPHARIWRENDAGEIGYAVTCCWDIGFCQGVNPEIAFTRTKTLMQGDTYCDHTYELEA